MLVNYNFHSHTMRCGHAVGSDEAYVLAAIQAGVKVMGFSDHTPYRDHEDPYCRMKAEVLPEYLKSVLALKEKYKDQIIIKVGLEMEYMADQLEELKEYRQQIDYAILGQHMSHLENGYDNYIDTHDQATQLYGKQICEGIYSGLFSYVAHPDLFMYGKNEWNDTCVNITHDICQAAQSKKVALELNLGGIRRGLQSIGDQKRFHYPVEEFWTIVKEYKVPIVIGVDAHHPNHYVDEQSMKDMQSFIDACGLHIEQNYTV